MEVWVTHFYREYDDEIIHNQYNSIAIDTFVFILPEEEKS